MNELDEILHEQLHVARRIAKKMRKARKVMGPDPVLLFCQEANEKKIQFFESMISANTHLHKKHKRKKKEKNPDIRIIGAQPSEGSRIPGIRKWSPEYLPKIYDATHVRGEL